MNDDQVTLVLNQLAELVRAVKRLEDRVAHLAERPTRATVDVPEPKVRPYDWVHTCPNCSAGWVLDDNDTAHRCQECNH